MRAFGVAWVIAILCFSSLALAQFQEATQLDFPMDFDALTHGLVQISSQYVSEEQLSGMNQPKVDLKSFDTADAKTFLVGKVAFVVHRDIQWVKQTDLVRIQGMEKVYPHDVKVEKLDGSRFLMLVQTPFRIPFMPDFVSCQVSEEEYSLSKDSRSLELLKRYPVDPAFEMPDSVITRTCDQYNMIFKKTFLVSQFYKFSRSSTLIINYQVLQINDSVFRKLSWIPFVDFYKELIDHVKQKFDRLIVRINDERQ